MNLRDKLDELRWGQLYSFALHVLDELERAEAEYRTYTDADCLTESEIADIRAHCQHTDTLRSLAQHLEELLK